MSEPYQLVTYPDFLSIKSRTNITAILPQGAAAAASAGFASLLCGWCASWRRFFFSAAPCLEKRWKGWLTCSTCWRFVLFLLKDHESYVHFLIVMIILWNLFPSNTVSNLVFFWQENDFVSETGQTQTQRLIGGLALVLFQILGRPTLSCKCHDLTPVNPPLSPSWKWI